MTPLSRPIRITLTVAVVIASGIGLSTAVSAIRSNDRPAASAPAAESLLATFNRIAPHGDVNPKVDLPETAADLQRAVDLLCRMMETAVDQNAYRQTFTEATGVDDRAFDYARVLEAVAYETRACPRAATWVMPASVGIADAAR